MPELPEVETTVDQLKEKILKRKIINVWCDNLKMIKRVVFGKLTNVGFKEFKASVVSHKNKIENIKRKGKNILIIFNNDQIILIHQKLTGHLLLGKWQKRSKNGKWTSTRKGLLREKVNEYIHLIFWLDDGEMLILSDLRKFAKLVYGKKDQISDLPEIKELGPDPLDKNLTFGKFKAIIQKRNKRIKQALIDQKIIAGIGNIYSDEILWRARIHPFKRIRRLTQKELKKIYLSTKDVLKRAIKLRGESISNWRDTEGKRGNFDGIRKVYRRKGKPCPRCKTPIKRRKIGGRSTHFCPICQSS
ncbi:MAG: DNA-formamidopyrimidine glycosylase [Candidatus Bathyarchaeota archaeon]|nr:DNA-formamidopyrimidine glycosylase [Candidatus Bathyarchaeota archaeon]